MTTFAMSTPTCLLWTQANYTAVVHSPLPVQRGEFTVTYPAAAWERLDRRIVRTEDCWVWPGARNRVGGYGIAWMPGSTRPLYVHRLFFERYVGPIPDGHQVDHLCSNPPCCNPEHLEAVTPRENTLRSRSNSAANARKSHCPQNHPFNEENTYLSHGGNKRGCRKCRHLQAASYRARKRAAAA